MIFKCNKLPRYDLAFHLMMLSTTSTSLLMQLR